jgi:hypothetical protein
VRPLKFLKVWALACNCCVEETAFKQVHGLVVGTSKVIQIESVQVEISQAQFCSASHFAGCFLNHVPYERLQMRADLYDLHNIHVEITPVYFIADLAAGGVSEHRTFGAQIHAWVEYSAERHAGV